uniref:Uncharacterized protein n=1 Tax=Glossina brevipalpis TaxID=37001 RepID=A0A1A9W4P0_9MUSC
MHENTTISSTCTITKRTQTRCGYTGPWTVKQKHQQRQQQVHSKAAAAAAAASAAAVAVAVAGVFDCLLLFAATPAPVAAFKLCICKRKFTTTTQHKSTSQRPARHYIIISIDRE